MTEAEEREIAKMVDAWEADWIGLMDKRGAKYQIGKLVERLRAVEQSTPKER